MGHNHEHPEETHAQKTEREAQERAARAAATSQNNPAETSIWEAIKGFLKFLFEMFFPSKDAPNEDVPSAPPETAMDRLRLGKLIIDANAVPKWEEYMRDHKGDVVNFQSPVVGKSEITSGFGHRHAPTAGASTNHAGVDFGARDGNPTPPIVASASGIVLFAGRKQGYGETVIIGHADGSYTLYGHMNGAHRPAIGSEITQGMQIGVMGATGTATATHLHYEQRKGEAALQPMIAGVKLVEGVRVASATAPKQGAFAGLVDPKAHPTLPVQQGGTPRPIAGVANAGVGTTGRTH